MIHTFKSIKLTTKCLIDFYDRMRVVFVSSTRTHTHTHICRIYTLKCLGVISMPSTQTHSRFGNLISLQYLYTRRLLFFTCIRVHVFGVCFRLCLCLCCCCMIYIKTLSKSMNLIQQSAHMYSMQIYTLVFAIAFGSSFSTGCCRSHTLNQSLFSSNIHRTKLFLGKCVNKRKNKPIRSNTRESG